MGQNTNLLQKKNQIITFSNKAEVLKKINQKKRFFDLGRNHDKFFFKISPYSYPTLATNFSKEKKKKKNKYLNLKKKVIRSQNEKRAF